jgi:hypothetical protein
MVIHQLVFWHVTIFYASGCRGMSFGVAALSVAVNVLLGIPTLNFCRKILSFLRCVWNLSGTPAEIALFLFIYLDMQLEA